MYRIVYKTDTGKIETCRRMSDAILALQLQQAPNLASINGYVENTMDYKINLETLEVESQTNPFTTFDINKWMRQRRNNLLKESDWTQGEDSPLTAEKKAEWATYRQALRDVPANNSSAINREDVVWPTPPGA
jgi:hypothetical protein